LRSFTDINNNAKYIKSLKHIDFKVDDFPMLNEEDDTKRNLLLDALAYQSNLKSSEHGAKIAEGIKKRRNLGKTVGNTRIGDIAKKEGVLARVKKAITNENSRKLYKEIIALTNQPDISTNFNKIARLLNKRGFVSRRGGKLFAKSVERVFQRYQGLEKEYFNPKTDLTISADNTLQTYIPNFVSKQNFPYDKGLIVFNVKNISPNNISLKNNKEEVVKLNNSNHSSDFIIDFEKENNIFPGLYFLEIKTSKETIRGHFYIGKEIIES